MSHRKGQVNICWKREWAEFLNLEISGNYGKEITCKPRKICTKYIPYSHTASLAVGCKFHSELPISQSKEKKNLLKIWFNEYLQDLKSKVAQMKHNHPCVGLKAMSPWSLPKGCWLGYRQCVPGYTCIRYSSKFFRSIFIMSFNID